MDENTEIGNNNHLLTSGLIYYVALHTKIPYIKIDDIRYELKLGSELGLDIDGDTIMIVTNEDGLHAVRVPWIHGTSRLSTITVGNPIYSAML